MTEQTIKATEAKTERKRTRRTSVQVGPLAIPQEYLRPELHYRFVKYNPARLDQLYKLGYDPIRLRDKDHEDLLKVVGDQTMRDLVARDGEFLVVTSESGAKLVLCSTPKELFAEGLKEKHEATLAIERANASKAKTETGINPTLTQTTK